MSFRCIGPGVSGLDAKYKFLSLPVTEALATSQAFVCEFNNATAASDETGVGGGLTGPDLVLPQVNNVPGAFGGFRQLTKDTNMSLNATAGFFNNFLQAPAGWAGLWMLKDIDVSVLSGNRNFLLGMRGYNVYSFISASITSNNRRSISLGMQTTSATDAIGAAIGNADNLSSNPADANFGLLVSSDYATKTAFAGIFIGTIQPKSFGDFLYFSLSKGDVAFSSATAITSFDHSGTFHSVIGSSDANWTIAGVKIASVTFSKYPVVVPS